MVKTNLPSISSEQNISLYLQRIRKFPILSNEEEANLLYLWIHHRKLAAAHKLVTAHLRLVVKVALKFRHYGLPIMDIISEGNIGLMKAVKKFDPEKGSRLSTYAMWWIKASIQDYIIKSWSMVKVSSGILQKKLFTSIAKLKEKIESSDEEQDSNLKNNYQAIYLNEKLDKYQNTEFVDIISDNQELQDDNLANNQLKTERMLLLEKAINFLSPREKYIIENRKLSETPVTLELLSKKYNVSSERIRQIEESALKKIKSYTLNISR